MKEYYHEDVLVRIYEVLERMDQRLSKLEQITNVNGAIDDQLVGISEISVALSISDRKIRQLIKNGAIPYYRSGAKYLLSIRDVKSALKAPTKRKIM